MSSAPERWNILFVCLGNICRSPAAEIIFRQMVEDRGRRDSFKIDSAGTIGSHQGEPPDSRMSAALQRHGYQISGSSRKIQVSDLESFDLILTMDESNLADVCRLDPNRKFHGKIRPFAEFCSNHDVPRIPDPYYGGQSGFENVIELLEDGCRGVLLEFQSEKSDKK